MPLDFTQYRFQHTYILGSSGTGKSTLMKRFILDDIYNNQGVLFIDFHGEDTDDLIQHIPPEHINRTILIDPSLKTIPINVLANVPKNKRGVVAMSVLDMFREIAKYPPNLSTPNFDQYILYTVLALLETANSTLLDIKLMLSSVEFRDSILNQIDDPVVIHFWRQEHDKLPSKDKVDRISSVLNKISVVLADKRIRHLVSYPHNVLDLKQCRLNKNIVLVKLPQSEFGLEGSRMLGRIILTAFFTVATQDSTPFHLYLDEVHNLQGPILNEMLSGIRKKNVSLTLAHQYLNQLSTDTLNAVLGNTGTKVIFRISINDANLLEPIFPGDNLRFFLFEMPQYTARLQTPASPTTSDIDTEPLDFAIFRQSERQVRKKAKELGVQSRTIEKHIKWRMGDGEV